MNRSFKSSNFKIKNKTIKTEKSESSKLFKGTEKYDWIMDKNIIYTSKKRKNFDEDTYKNMETIKNIKESGLFNYELLEGKNPNMNIISIEDIEEMFEIINPEFNGKKIKNSDLENFVEIIQPNFPKNELSCLTLDKEVITSEEIQELLNNYYLKDFDINNELFNVLSNNKEEIDENQVIKMMKELKICNIMDSDIQILKECLDLNKDGKITKDDFINTIKSFK